MNLLIIICIGPANSIIEWKIDEWEHNEGSPSPYVGEPRSSVIEAWDDIFDSMNNRLFTPTYAYELRLDLTPHYRYEC